jgi:pyruvate formate lyase activating enzyme
MPDMTAARFWRREPDGRVACSLCPNACRIAEGGHGVCGVRANRGGVLELPFHGRVSAVSMDPIEKKPLYHFHPGSSILSVGFVGCSLRCGFCQNHHISQTTDAETRPLSPSELVRTAQERGSFAIAYTYSEPLVHMEYVLESARLARTAGLKNVLVSNGYVQEAPAEELIPLLDAANIDLKSFDPEFYRRETGGKLEEVKRFISQAAGRLCLEVTTLIIPGHTDGAAQIEAIARFLASLDPEIPLHLSCYFPQYKYTAPPTRPETVMALAETARRHLQFVYPGNVGFAESNTLCPSCGSLLIRRAGYRTRVEGLAGGCCRNCGREMPIAGV